MILVENNMATQFEIMTEENKNDAGSYVPNYDELIAEAPNDEMVAKWISSKELHESLAEKDVRYGGFAFNCVYMMKMSCGHYEIFQHSARSEEELVDWIKMMQSDEYYKKCTSCICDFK